MPLPPDVLATSEPEQQVQVGDVWWIPADLVDYPDEKQKARFCLVVALELAVGSQQLVRAHYVAGSTRKSSRPRIVTEPGEANLVERTYFKFWFSSSIPIPKLIARGKLRGRVGLERKAEIGPAIRASKLMALKRLVGC